MRVLVVAVLLLSLPTQFAKADTWSIGASYSHIENDDLGADVNLGVLAVSLGYRFGGETGWRLHPEIRLGAAAGDDTVHAGVPVTVDIEDLLALSLRAEYGFEKVYLFVQPSYVRLEFEIDAGGNTFFSDDGDYGLGAGVGFEIGERTSLELIVEDFDGTLTITGGARLTF